MRILHVITSLRIGGAEKLLTQLVPAIIAHGHDAEIALLDATPTPLIKQMQSLGIKVHELGHKYRSIYNPLRARDIGKLMSGFDIVHTHNTTPQLFTAWAARKLTDGPVLVTTEHNTKNRRRGWGWYKRIDRWMYSHYSKIVCVHDSVRDSLASHLGGLYTDRMTVIDNGIDYDLFAGAKPTIEFKFMFPGKKLVAMVAAFRKQKDHATLLRAISELPDDYALVLAGDGDTRREMEALASELGISHRVAFLGFRTDVCQILKSADIIVQSTHYEGLSLSLIEAMASGRPYIASDVDGVHQVASGSALLFPDGDSKALAQLIAKVGESEHLSNEVASKCQEKAKKYNISHTLELYISLYQSLARDNKGETPNDKN